MVEEFNVARYQSGSFSLINVGSGFHCLYSHVSIPMVVSLLIFVYLQKSHVWGVVFTAFTALPPFLPRIFRFTQT